MHILFLLLLAVITYSLPFTVEDLHDLKRLGDYDIYNDQVVYSVRHWDAESSITTTGLKMFKIGDYENTVRSIYWKDGISAFNPVFKDQDHVLFLGTASGSAQIYEIDMSLDVAKRVTDYPVGINGFKYSDGFVVGQIDVYADCQDLQCTADIDAEVAARGDDSWMEFDKLMVRHWDVWESGKVAHLFKIDLDDAAVPLDLMKGYYYNSPIPPFGGSEEFTFSITSDVVIFTAEDVSSSKAAWTTGWNIYTVNLDGTGLKEITGITQARTQNPVLSPDGETIAYVAMDRPGFEADRLHINIYNIKTFVSVPVTSLVDISFDTLVWLNANTLIGDADSNGFHVLYTIDVATGAVKQITKSGASHSVKVVDGIIYFARTTMTAPNNIFMMKTVDTEPAQISFENKKRLKDIEMVVPQSFTFDGSLDAKIQGWYLPPLNYEANGPAVLLIHGGPEGSWGDSWSYRWNPQLWAAHNISTFMFNIHGSTGFGQAFEDAVAGNWGLYPYQDIVKGVAYIKDHYDFDSKRIAACGASYGGFMINWLLGHNKDTEFTTLIVHDGMFDTRISYYDTDELWFPEWEFKGKPYENPENYEEYNPLRFVEEWDTPTLIVHGGRDYRLDKSQGFSTFTALQRKGIDSALLYFPEENHWVLKPQNGIKWYDSVLGWLDEHN